MLYTKYIDDRYDRRAVQHNAGIDLLTEGILKEYSIKISSLDIAKADFGKPYLPQYPNIFFSISHCNGLAVCLISDSNCGVDCEKIRTSRDNVAHRIFSENELKVYEKKTGGQKDIFFTALWTLKEAYGKADGRGIAAMKYAEFYTDNGIICSSVPFRFRLFLDGEYMIALCSEQDISFECRIGEEIFHI